MLLIGISVKVPTCAAATAAAAGTASSAGACRERQHNSQYYAISIVQNNSVCGTSAKAKLPLA